jgi:DNA (cytosine-5)-methyltransferase 1
MTKNRDKSLELNFDCELIQRSKCKFNIKGSTFIDLFSGIGGFRIALEHFGLKCVFSSEWDKFAKITYRENFGDIPYGDITHINAIEIPAHNILCAGFPCQAFSISGKQKGFSDTRGTLFFDVARIAEFHQPEILFLENVRNFERHDGGKTLQVVVKTLESLNYHVFYRVLNSSYYGSPTSRERIYFVCFRKDLGVNIFRFPDRTNEHVMLKDFLEDDHNTKKYIIKRDDIKLSEKHLTSDIFGTYPLRPIRIGTINNGGQGERIYSVNGHSVTLSAYGGGVASKTGAYLVDGKIRKLSPRECARIMGFPDTFKIPVTDSQAYKQFGNSVVISVLKSIFKAIISTLGG